MSGKEFFQAVSLEEARAFSMLFEPRGRETVPLGRGLFRVLAESIESPEDVPGFPRSTMDGFAVAAASTFGASLSNPALLEVAGSVSMGRAPDFSVGQGCCGRIPTGGMLPRGADAVVMVEHTEEVDDRFVECYRSVAPGDHVILAGDDVARGETLLAAGHRLRPQDLAFLAGAGVTHLPVFPPVRVAVLSTGDEIAAPGGRLSQGMIRDMNGEGLAALCRSIHAEPSFAGIVKDDPELLYRACSEALKQSDMLLVSGGSSVGGRDHTLEAIQKLPGTRVCFHGVAMSPGKPTILAQTDGKAVFGLPGHVASCMVVFLELVRPFLDRMAGLGPDMARRFPVPATLTRNIASKQGRADFVRVRLLPGPEGLLAEPVIGKSGEVRTLVASDGLVRIEAGCEGLYEGDRVLVDLFPGHE
ncbi:MAG: gephyrin-like molybdotransferase Glp [Thermodesulfobacteriota bacterium]